MKKWCKKIAAGLAVLLIACIGLVSYQFNRGVPEPVLTDADPENLKYFSESYESCRKGFRRAVANVLPPFLNARASRLKIDSRKTSDLTIDYCYIPAQKETGRLLILLSGIHGVEGYTGSAVQQMFLNEIVPGADLEQMGILVVHAVNPYGFKYKRRVTENNVDLNRNCMVNPDGFQKENKGYAALNRWLNKKRNVKLTGFDHFFFPFYAVQKMLYHSKKTIRQAILQGQYQYEDGIYFGGKSLEPNIEALTPLIQQVARPYKMVFAIDLHTGYGKRGTLHLFPMSPDSIKKKQRIERLFKGFHIDWGDGNDFYTVDGDLLSYLGTKLSPPVYLSMPFEFGTLDTQTTMGSLKALHNVMIENQGFHYGYASQRDKTISEKRFLEGYFPSSPAWRSKVLDNARVLLKHTIRTYGRLHMD